MVLGVRVGGSGFQGLAPITLPSVSLTLRLRVCGRRGPDCAGGEQGDGCGQEGEGRSGAPSGDGAGDTPGAQGKGGAKAGRVGGRPGRRSRLCGIEQLRLIGGPTCPPLLFDCTYGL